MTPNHHRFFFIDEANKTLLNINGLKCFTCYIVVPVSNNNIQASIETEFVLNPLLWLYIYINYK